MATQMPAPPNAKRRAVGAAGVVVVGGEIGLSLGGDGAGSTVIGVLAVSPLTAANASTRPYPTYGSQPAAGRCAVSLMRCITCRAVSCGERDRTSATSYAAPVVSGIVATIGVAVPRTGTVSTRPSPSASSDTTASPGAATSTHGPANVKRDAA